MAAGFGTLAGHFTDRTVVTYDSRGSERNVRCGELARELIQADLVSGHLWSAISCGEIRTWMTESGQCMRQRPCL